MNLHPDLAALQARYDELVAAVENGTLDAATAMSTLAASCVTDATGAEWRIDPAGNWTRNMPGAYPTTEDPSGFVATAGWSDNGWGANDQIGGGINSPYSTPVDDWSQGSSQGGMAQSYDPNAYDPNAYDPNAYDPNAYDPNSYDPNSQAPGGFDPAGAPPQQQRTRGSFDIRSLLPSMPSLPKLRGSANGTPKISLPSGKARTAIVLVICLIVAAGAVTRGGGATTDKPATKVPTELPTTAPSVQPTQTPEATTPDAQITTPAAQTSPTTTTSVPGTSTKKEDAPDLTQITAGKGKGITLEQAQAVIGFLVAGRSSAGKVTGATGGQLIDVAATFAGAKKLGYVLKAESFSAASSSSAVVTVSAKDESGRTVATWNLTLVTFKGRWVVGGYPQRV